MIAQRAAFHNTQFNFFVALTIRVKFFDACSLSKEILACDNHCKNPRGCLIEEEVSKVHLFTSSAAGNKCREELIA